MRDNSSGETGVNVAANRLGPNAYLVGRPGSADMVTTPALIIDREMLFYNLETLTSIARSSGLRLWPHAKTHKSSKIALLQVQFGADGISVANVHEAETLSRAGIERLLITSPVIGAARLRRVTELRRSIKEVIVVVDCVSNLTEIADAARTADVEIGVVIDIDVGMGRTGVTDPNQAVALARAIASSRSLYFCGVQAYSGAVQHIVSYDDRKEIYFQHLDVLQHHLELLKKSGSPAKMVTGGGTGTLGLDIERGIITDHQAGSYVFMDVQYQPVEIFRSQNSQRFQSSLSLLSTVVSASTPGRATVDSGFKSLSTDGPAPDVITSTSSPRSFQFYGDEHGQIYFDQAEVLPVGSKVRLRPPHCDPTVNLHDYLHVMSGDLLYDIWSVDARGSL